MGRNGVEDHPYREFERSGWQRAAPGYSGSFEAATRLFAPVLLEAVGAGRGAKLLDVACGPGLVAGLAAARGAEVTGLDFSPQMLARARERHSDIDFREGDAEALPFADRAFDAVLSNFGVHHFPFPERALAEAHRVLRAGGRVAFTTWATPDEHVLHRIFFDAVRAAGDASASLPTAPGGALNEPERCLRLLREAGFPNVTLRAEILRAELPVASVGSLVELIEAGTVRMAATLRAQPAQKRSAILAAVEEGLAPYRDAQGYRVPLAAILARATK